MISRSILVQTAAGVDWTLIGVLLTAAFTGATAFISALIYVHGRTVAGHRQTLRIRSPRGRLFVEGALGHGEWPARERVRCALIHVFNQSDRRQTIEFDQAKTRSVLPRRLHARVAMTILEIQGDEGNNVLIALEADDWGRYDEIDVATGLSKRALLLRITATTQNGERLRWIGWVHVRSAPGYRQPTGTAG